jgi:hypothetical protein
VDDGVVAEGIMRIFVDLAARPKGTARPGCFHYQYITFNFHRQTY